MFPNPQKSYEQLLWIAKFISWYMLGYQEGVYRFSGQRLDDDVEIVKEDTYFSIQEKGTRLGACQKKCVKKVSFLVSKVSLRHLG